MNNTIAGQVFVFLVVGAAFFFASLYLGGQFDIIAEMRDQVGSQA
jgi:hypothetical protein